jgi:glutathione-regulated potassium-efflux system ancillary protein KefF
MIFLVFAHPYPSRSRANAALLGAVRDLPGVELRSLYDCYPDFDIDVAAEQAALKRAHAVVWMSPLYWYSVPGLLKHWFDQVLSPGWAYGNGARALAGKRALWVVTTGGDAASYGEGAAHGQSFERFLAPLEQMARFCAMEWEAPFVVHGAHAIGDDELHRQAARLAQRFRSLLPPEAAKEAAQ